MHAEEGGNDGEREVVREEKRGHRRAVFRRSEQRLRGNNDDAININARPDDRRDFEAVRRACERARAQQRADGREDERRVRERLNGEHCAQPERGGTEERVQEGAVNGEQGLDGLRRPGG